MLGVTGGTPDDGVDVCVGNCVTGALPDGTEGGATRMGAFERGGGRGTLCWPAKGAWYADAGLPDDELPPYKLCTSVLFTRSDLKKPAMVVLVKSFVRPASDTRKGHVRSPIASAHAD